MSNGSARRTQKNRKMHTHRSDFMPLTAAVASVGEKYIAGISDFVAFSISNSMSGQSNNIELLSVNKIFFS